MPPDDALAPTSGPIRPASRCADVVSAGNEIRRFVVGFGTESGWRAVRARAPFGT
jgi:hypothetical protein